MYQNSMLKDYESDIIKTVDGQKLTTIINYVEQLVIESEKDFTDTAKKYVVQSEYHTTAIIKNGIYLGYKDILDRLIKLRKI